VSFLNITLGFKIPFYPDLAVQVGVEAAIVLSLVHLWSHEEAKLKDGRYWVEKEFEDFQTALPFWDKPVINETLKGLRAKNLVLWTGEYSTRNEHTKWFSVNHVQLDLIFSLKSSRSVDTQETQLDADVEAWAFGAEAGVKIQRPLLNVAPRRRASHADPTSPAHLQMIYRVCYGAETVAEQKMLTSTQRGRAADAVASLLDAGANISGDARRFEKWWANNWRSKDKSGQYQFPTPAHIVELWLQAMKTIKRDEPAKEQPKQEDVYSMMRQRAELRKR
jgi:hypothetical protein